MRIILLSLMFCLLSACGQKGDLYLPEDQAGTSVPSTDQ